MGDVGVSVLFWAGDRFGTGSVGLGWFQKNALDHGRFLGAVFFADLNFCDLQDGFSS